MSGRSVTPSYWDAACSIAAAIASSLSAPMLALAPTSVCAARFASAKSLRLRPGLEKIRAGLPRTVLEALHQSARQARIAHRDFAETCDRDFGAAWRRALSRRTLGVSLNDVAPGADADRGRVALEHRFEALAFDRFRDHVVHAGSAAGLDLLFQRACRQSHDGHARAARHFLADAAGGLEPVHDRHLHVHQYEVDRRRMCGNGFAARDLQASAISRKFVAREFCGSR